MDANRGTLDLTGWNIIAIVDIDNQLFLQLRKKGEPSESIYPVSGEFGHGTYIFSTSQNAEKMKREKEESEERQRAYQSILDRVIKK